MGLGKLTKLALIPIITGSLGSCTNKSKVAEVPNLGVVEVDFSKDGKEIKGQCIDVDNDKKVDGVLGDGYLMFYKEGYEIHPDFKRYYDSSRSLILSEENRENLSKLLRENNYQEYIKSFKKSK